MKYFRNLKYRHVPSPSSSMSDFLWFLLVECHPVLVPTIGKGCMSSGSCSSTCLGSRWLISFRILEFESCIPLYLSASAGQLPRSSHGSQSSSSKIFSITFSVPNILFIYYSFYGFSSLVLSSISLYIVEYFFLNPFSNSLIGSYEVVLNLTLSAG